MHTEAFDNLTVQIVEITVTSAYCDQYIYVCHPTAFVLVKKKIAEGIRSNCMLE